MRQTTTASARVLVLGAGVAGLTTAIALARRGIPVDVLEQDRTPAPRGRREAGGWYRDSVPQAGQGHVFSPHCYRLLADELPDVLARLLELGARELAMGGSGEAAGALPAEGFGLAVRRPVFDWVLRRVAEREPGVRVHGGLPATGLQISGGQLSGVLVRGGVVATELAVDATGGSGPVSGWLDDLGQRAGSIRLAEPREDPDTAPARAGADHYTRCYALHWRDDPGPLNLGLAAGGEYGGYSCRLVPADNHTFTVTFTVPAGALGDPARPGRPEPADPTPAGLVEPGLAGLCTPEGFQAAARRLPLIADWVDPGVAEPLTGVTTLTVSPARRGRAEDVMRLPGLVPVGDALHAGDPSWCSGVAVALASALACARAVRARRDTDIAGAEAAAHGAAVWTEVWAEAARVAGKAACASARLPGPSARDLAVWLTGSVPASVG
jgi:hypothetical protein